MALRALAAATVALTLSSSVWANEGAGSDSEPVPTEAAAAPSEKPDSEVIPAPKISSPNVESSASKDKPPLSAYDRLRQKNNQPIEDERTLTGQLLRTLVALGIVVGLIYLVFKLGLGRLLQGGGFGGLSSAAQKEVRVLERTAIDGKSALYLVELSGERRILVGSGDQGVRYLCEVSSVTAPPPGEQPERTFSAVLQEQSEGVPHDASE